MMERFIVMLHGFTNLDENNQLCRETGKPVVSQEHCEFDSEECDGWNVWVRDNEGNEEEPFTSIEPLDRDFETFAEADTYAEALADLAGLIIDYY